MSSQKDICVHIVTKKLGINAAKIAQFLFSKKSSTVQEIYKATEIEIKKLRQLMIILFKIGFITLEEGTRDKFQLSKSKILGHSRTLLYLNFLKGRLGELACSLANSLIVLNITTFEECVQETLKFLNLPKRSKEKM